MSRKIVNRNYDGKTSPKIFSISEAIKELRHRAKLQKSVKFWKMPIKNLELFEELRASGKIREVRPGLWDLE